MVLALFETAAGYAIFKILNDKKLAQPDNLYKEFETPEAANKLVKLKTFTKFKDMTDALQASTAAVEGKIGKPLKKLLKQLVSEEVQDQLLVADAKLGNAIREKFNLNCVSNNSVQELMRCIRSQLESLIGEVSKKELAAMALGLAHSLSRYKLKFSPDKVDTMIVNAISLLDDVDKEMNIYVMRIREWYGWHFPELGKLISDHVMFIKCIRLMGTRENAKNTDFSDILPSDLEDEVKKMAEVSMGAEIADDDMGHVHLLCDQVLNLSNYRTQLYEYLCARMMAIAPNLTTLVGELVGARLVSHAGSLINLAKHPASTIQILGAEKALFRALKTKKDTPKYGLIYHSQIVGQSSAKIKGKASRMLANKVALSTRFDALGDTTGCELGIEHRAKLQARLNMLEQGNLHRISGTGKAKAKFQKYHFKSEVVQYPDAADSTIQTGIKRKRSDSEGEKKFLIEEISSETFAEEIPKKKKKIKTEEPEDQQGSSKKKKKIKKEKDAENEEYVEGLVKEEPVEEETTTPKKKKKSKHRESTNEEQVDAGDQSEQQAELTESGKKKKKKKKSLQLEDGDQ